MLLKSPKVIIYPMSDLTVFIILFALVQAIEVLIVWFVLKQYEKKDDLHRECIELLQKHIDELERQQKDYWKFIENTMEVNTGRMN